MEWPEGAPLAFGSVEKLYWVFAHAHGVVAEAVRLELGDLGPDVGGGGHLRRAVDVLRDGLDASPKGPCRPGRGAGSRPRRCPPLRPPCSRAPRCRRSRSPSGCTRWRSPPAPRSTRAPRRARASVSAVKRLMPTTAGTPKRAMLSRWRPRLARPEVTASTFSEPSSPSATPRASSGRGWSRPPPPRPA